MITTIRLLIIDTSFFSRGLLFSTLMLSAITLGLHAILYMAYGHYMLQKQPRPVPYCYAFGLLPYGLPDRSHV